MAVTKYYQVRERTDPDGTPVIEAYRYNQFTDYRVGGYEDSSGAWSSGFKPDATNDADGTPIGSPDADLRGAYSGEWFQGVPVNDVDADGPIAKGSEGSGPAPAGEAFNTTKLWP